MISSLLKLPCNPISKTLAGLLMVVFLAHNSQASLVTWDLTGAPGNQTTEVAVSTAANVTGGIIARGSELGVRTTPDSFNSNGWDGDVLATPSVDNRYIALSFSVADGYFAELDFLSLRTRASNTGPGKLGLFYNGDGFSNVIFTFSQNGNSTSDWEVPLSGLGNLTGDVEFRIIKTVDIQADGSGDVSGGGTFRLDNNINSSGISISGTIAAIPEATPMLLGTVACSLLGLTYLGRRGWQKQQASSQE